MLDRDNWQEIYQTLRSNPLRTFLTAFGVFWGIFMLLVMLGSSNGLSNGAKKSMRGTAQNSVFLWGQRTSQPYRGMQPGRRIRFNNSDVDALRAKLDGVEYLSPRIQVGGFRGGGTVMRKGETGSFSVMGDYPEILLIQGLVLTNGRFINHLDLKEKRKVAVIGSAVRDQLFEPYENPVGDYIKISGVYFLVVGVVTTLETGDRAARQTEAVMLPFTTFQQAFNVGDDVGWIAMTAKANVSAEALENHAREILADRHKISPDDPMGIGSFNMQKVFRRLSGLFMAITIVTWIVGVITLLAGGIGVSNIMVITVKERTKEIGLRKALGATPRQIVGMIIQESVVLTIIAGYTGIVAGVGLLELGASLSKGAEMFDNPTVDLNTAALAAFLLILVGAVAGLIPAYRAAKIHPVEALRTE